MLYLVTVYNLVSLLVHLLWAVDEMASVGDPPGLTLMTFYFKLVWTSHDLLRCLRWDLYFSPTATFHVICSPVLVIYLVLRRQIPECPFSVGTMDFLRSFQGFPLYRYVPKNGLIGCLINYFVSVKYTFIMSLMTLHFLNFNF